MDSAESWRDASTAALLYGGVMLAASYLAGDGLQLVPNAVNGLAMGAASLGDSVIHSAIEMDPSVLSSGVMTGLVFAGIQMARGDRNYVRNIAAGGATSIVVDTFY